MKKLTLVETAAQAIWFSNQAEQEPPLVITPEAAYACQKLGQPYLKLEDLVQISKRLAEYSSNLHNYLEWEAWLDNWAQNTIPEFGKAGFKPASAVTTELQILFAEIWSAAVNLFELIQKIQPTQVALWPPKIINVPWYLHPSVSSLPALLPSVAQRCGLELLDLSSQAPDLAPVSQAAQIPAVFSLKSWLKRRLLRIPAVVGLVTTRSLDWQAIFKRAESDAPHILFSGYGYDLIPLGQELRRQGVRVTILPDALPDYPVKLPKKLEAALTAAGKQLLLEPQVWFPLERWGLDRVDLWAKPLEAWWHRKVPKLWLHHQRVQRLIAQNQFSALVTWDNSGNTLSGVITNGAASTHQVPRYLYQHGSSSGVDANFWQGYLRYPEVLLAYGQGTEDELQQSCPSFLKPHAAIVPVGSGRLDLLRRQYRPDAAQKLRTKLQAGDPRPLIMYIPTCFATYGRGVNSDLIAYPDVSYFELMQNILRLWKDRPEVRLLYKDLIVANDPNQVMPDFINTHISDAIVTNQRLTDLMWAVDAIVIDHVITAIGEVLLTNKPLVVYMPQPNTSSPQAINLLRKRATVAETPAEFITEVGALLQLGQYPELQNPDTEFLKLYCTHLHDGNSAQRAASVILKSKPAQTLRDRNK